VLLSCLWIHAISAHSTFHLRSPTFAYLMLHLRSVSVHMRVLVQELASLKSVAVCRSLPFLARSIPIFVSNCLSVETACSVTSSILCSFSADIEHFSKFEINIPKSDHLKHFFIISYVRLKFKLPVCNVRLRERALHSTVPNLIAKKTSQASEQNQPHFLALAPGEFAFPDFSRHTSFPHVLF
jgi:hypothetical protein